MAKVRKTQGDEYAPVLSVGLAVRNGQISVNRCIESILAQDFVDLELVICDNVSDDGTLQILEHHAHNDRRVKLSLNEVNIGSHENMNRVLALSRGTFFRWISADDWLEPGCLSTCVEALKAHPEAIGVTTGFTICRPDGSLKYEKYGGEFPTSADPARRFERMLWFCHAGDAKYDAIYGMYRRDRVMRSRMLRSSEQTDWLLSAELALIGPIIHIPDRLANRTRTSQVGIDQAAFRRRLDPARAEHLRTSPQRTYRELLDLVVSQDLTAAQLRRCRAALRRFWAKETIRVARLEASNVWHRMTRHQFARAQPV
jgi:glycosyltransferase involved in cell wall biosynthesis